MLHILVHLLFLIVGLFLVFFLIIVADISFSLSSSRLLSLIHCQRNAFALGIWDHNSILGGGVEVYSPEYLRKQIKFVPNLSGFEKIKSQHSVVIFQINGVFGGTRTSELLFHQSNYDCGIDPSLLKKPNLNLRDIVSLKFSL